MRQRSSILDVAAPVPAGGGNDNTRLVAARKQLRDLDKEIKRLREEHQVKLTELLEQRDHLVRTINALGI